MSPLPPDSATRRDPLLDAYRQASEREGGRPGAQVRSAVLSHARVVAQSRPLATHGSPASAVSQAVLDAPAANDRAPLWRLAAGVVIGLVGVLIFQLTRPEATPENSTASVSGTVTAAAPQVATTNAEPSVAAKVASVTSPEKSVAAAAPTASPVLAQATVAPRTINEARTQPAEPSGPASARDNNVAAREVATDRARAEQTIALAKIPAPAAAPAPEIASSNAADTASSEVMIASVETRKSARAPAPASAPLPSAPPSSPVAFPAVTQEAAIASAPAARASAASAATPARRTESSGLSGWTGWNSEADQALFKALNAGDLPSVRAAIARGANVNARDERGRTALQVARERADSEASRVLEAAGAR